MSSRDVPVFGRRFPAGIRFGGAGSAVIDRPEVPGAESDTPDWENVSEALARTGEVSATAVAGVARDVLTLTTEVEVEEEFEIVSHAKWSGTTREQTEQARRKRLETPFVGVYPEGQMRFTLAALTLLGSPDAVRLGFMKNVATGEAMPGVISVHPVPAGTVDKMAYKLTKQPGTVCRYASATGFFAVHPELVATARVDCPLHQVVQRGVPILDATGLPVFLLRLAEGQPMRTPRHRKNTPTTALTNS